MVRQIKLTQDQVQKFVSVTSKCDFDIDIYYNRYIVDAKSFLGVYGLDFPSRWRCPMRDITRNWRSCWAIWQWPADRPGKSENLWI